MVYIKICDLCRYNNEYIIDDCCFIFRCLNLLVLMFVFLLIKGGYLNVFKLGNGF